MTEQIVTTIITACGLIVVQLIISLKSQRAADIRNEYVLKGLEEKLETYKEETNKGISKLEEQTKKQNEIVTSVTRLEAENKVLFHYIDDIREDIDDLKEVKMDKY